MSRSHASLSGARLAASAAIASLAVLSVIALLASVLVGVAHSADPPLSPPVGPPQGDVRCEGVVLNVSVDNVVVPQGATCVLAGTQVRGSVLAEPQSTLTLGAGTGVRGNVEVKEDARLLVDRSRIGGNVKCDGCNPLNMTTSAIGGSYQVVGSRSGVLIFDTDIAGDLEVVGGFAPLAASVLSSVVGGNVKLEKNAGFVFVSDATIGGSLQSIEGVHGSLLFNRVGGNLQVFKNRGAAPTQITGNTITEALQCKDNEPPPFAFANSARSFEGQCGPPG